MTRQILVLLLMGVAGCENQHDREVYQQQFRSRVDAAAEARIDSAYKAIQERCDSLMEFRVPVVVDSIVSGMKNAK